MPDTPVSTSSRIAALLRRLSNRRSTRSPTVQRLLLAGAVVLFVSGAAYAVNSLDGVPLADDWALWIGVAAALSVTTFGVNGLEFAVSASLLSKRPPFAEVMRVSILGSAANVLPIPGAALVRVAALGRMELGYRPAVSITAVIGLAWVGTGCLASAWLLLAAGEQDVGGLLLLGGVGAVAAGVGLLVVELSWGRAVRALPAVFAVELASVAVGVMRMWVILRAIGADASLADASALIVVAIVASAAGLLPGGLGLREALSAAVSVAIGITAAVGVLATVIDRVVGYVVLALATAVVMIVSPPPSGRAGPDLANDVAGRQEGTTPGGARLT